MTFSLTLKLPCTLCIYPLPPVKKCQWRKNEICAHFQKRTYFSGVFLLGKSRLAARQGGWNHLKHWSFPCHQNTYWTTGQTAKSIRIFKGYLHSLPDVVKQIPEWISFIKVLHCMLASEVVCSWFLLFCLGFFSFLFWFAGVFSLFVCLGFFAAVVVPFLQSYFILMTPKYSVEVWFHQRSPAVFLRVQF